MLRALAAGLLLAALVAPAAAADWPQFHNDSRKAGFQASGSYQPYKDLWWNVKIPGGATIETSPVVAEDVVLVGGSDKVLRAYDAASGTERWNYTMTDRVVATPAIHNGYVYAVDIKGALVKLELSTGKLFAQAAVGPTLAPVTLDEGKLFIGTEAGEMKAFEVESTEYAITALWTFTVGRFWADKSVTSAPAACAHPVGEVRSAAAVHDGIVYFGAMNNHVYAINEESEADGTVRAQWFNATEDIVLAAPAVDTTNNRVVFASYDGKVRSFHMDRPGPASCAAAQRLPVWTYTAPDNAQMRSSPATDGHRIYVGTNKGHVVAMTASGGSPVWGMSTRDIVVSSPAVSNGVLVVGSDDRNVYWLSASNGSVLKQFTAQSAIKSSPAIDGDRAFVASFDGTLYMFGPEIPKAPDLLVKSVALEDDRIAVTVENKGTAASPASSLRLLVDGEFVANLDVPAIEVGATATVTRLVELEAGTHAVKAIVDPDARTAEEDESNNEREAEVAARPTATEEPDEDGGGDGGGLKIPAPGLLPTLALLAMAALLLARRR